MINPKELRIGNWVLDPDGNEIQVESITELCLHQKCDYQINYDWQSDEKDSDLFCDNLSPIPISKKSLTLLGIKDSFDFGGASNFIYAPSGPFTCYINRPEGSVSIEEFGERDYPLEHIKYIHQLQNLYFMLKNKEMDLAEVANNT